jgi:predicted NUDIX family phosphoesterase
MNEEVMVVNTTDLAPFLSGQAVGIIREKGDEILHLIATTHFFVDRAIAERSPEYRQIIPYVIISHGDSFFMTTRLRKGNEARLHDKVSLGIGGHVNPGHDLLDGLQKELAEEVAIDDDFDIGFIGILNDESTEVGRVHLGAVYLMRAQSDRVRVLETEKISGRWASRTELTALHPSMESWSQIVWDEVLTKLESAV